MIGSPYQKRERIRRWLRPRRVERRMITSPIETQRPLRVACILLELSVTYSPSKSFFMPSLTPLQQLRRLDELSPQFPDQLTGLLREQVYADNTTNLQDDNLSWVVEYLNDVRPRVSFAN